MVRTTPTFEPEGGKRGTSGVPGEITAHVPARPSLSSLGRAARGSGPSEPTGRSLVRAVRESPSGRVGLRYRSEPFSTVRRPPEPPAFGPMSLLVLEGKDVRELLGFPHCNDRMAEAFRELSRGTVTRPLRSVLSIPDRSALLGKMPGGSKHPEIRGVKLITMVRENRERGRPSH